MASTFTNATCSIVLTALSASQAFACGGGGGGFGGYSGGYGGGYSYPSYSQPAYHQPVYQQPQRVVHQPQHYGQQPQYGQTPYGQQPYSGQPAFQPQGQSQGQPQFAQQPQGQPPQQPIAQQPQQQQAAPQAAAPQQQPTPQAASQPSLDASGSALDALAAFGGAPAAQGVSSQSPSFVGSWTANVNGTNRVQLQLDANGGFNWVANSNGKVSSFGGSYTLANGQLTLIRSSDNQQLAGTLIPESAGGFRFKLASSTGDGLLFVR
ncbi:hypothetical protein [Botrimarina mediterranea]|uniref:SLA1 homology domain-containing protein n=1 Tax=Botrimarina mediterranea TaxID=2528022 RepID=A0A518KAD2_9BACT|nr:hypothetical protein [Botrimarina mediterranea]QDV74757.1 hypothetical protein Spa11_29650 [Botrimarina mediterranea]QDV79402.1 hypothetical protein K2D_30160 [Planctomycetes bacterium K2D]